MRVKQMQVLSDGYRGFGLVMMLNWDRFLYTGMILAALMLGAWVGGQ